MKLNREQKRLLNNKYGGKFKFIDLYPKKRTKIKSLFVVVYDERTLHDSGYPFLRIFGEIEDKKLIDLGWHDHFLTCRSTNTDSYGKNILHIMPWYSSKGGFWISGNNIWCSTFEIKEDGELR